MPESRTAGGLQLLDLILQLQNLIFERDAFLALHQRLGGGGNREQDGEGSNKKTILAHRHQSKFPTPSNAVLPR